MILHIDMDAFFASIEQAINPRLKGRPLIVGSRGNKMHTVVCAASYEAKACGIDSGMSSREAFQVCPNLEFVPADQGKYIWTSEQIFAMLKGYGFELAYASIDEFQIDIGAAGPMPQATIGMAHESCDEMQLEACSLGLAKDIQKRIHETFSITASIGIAKNCLLAKLASKLNKPNGIAVLTQENLLEVLGKTPVEKLCGIGKASAGILYTQKIFSCLDLYQESPQCLERIFGKNGLTLYSSLHLSDSFSSLKNDEKPKSVGHSYTLPYVSETPRFIRAWLRLLSEMVGQRLRQKELVASTVHLWLNGPEIGNFGAQKTFAQATNDGYEVYRRAIKIMAQTARKRLRIRALGVTCSSLFKDDCPPLFIEQKRREGLICALDRINARFGEGTIFPAVVNITKKMQ